MQRKIAVYTSYDYGAPISEARMMTPKAYEIKLQGNLQLCIMLNVKEANSDTFQLALDSNLPARCKTFFDNDQHYC